MSVASFSSAVVVVIDVAFVVDVVIIGDDDKNDIWWSGLKIQCPLQTQVDHVEFALAFLCLCT